MIWRCSSKRLHGFQVLTYLVHLIILLTWSFVPRPDLTDLINLFQITSKLVVTLFSSLGPSILISGLFSELLFSNQFFHVLFHPLNHPICYFDYRLVVCFSCLSFYLFIFVPLLPFFPSLLLSFFFVYFFLSVSFVFFFFFSAA